ncbi:MAG: hypothetical protein K0R98_1165 [Rickettsiaceae bacterium]|jgi:uncharacterized protein (TIGR02466 family)|nr:hypothetical protein [Rickettsiaceae bacterium]
MTTQILEEPKDKKITVNNGKGGAINVFPTVIYVMPHTGDKISKMNNELERFILDGENKAKSLTNSSIRGGHHSDRQLLESDNWAVKELKQLLTDNSLNYLKSFWKSESSTPINQVKNFTMSISGWSMVMREGDWSVPHLHPRANISAVYYVTEPKYNENQAQDAGKLMLMDPRIRAGVFPIMNQVSSIMVPPEVGTIVMFPSYLKHYVMPFKGKGERISVAANLSFSQSALQGY